MRRTIKNDFELTGPMNEATGRRSSVTSRRSGKSGPELEEAYRALAGLTARQTGQVVEISR